jgi:hypothetical protein
MSLYEQGSYRLRDGRIFTPATVSPVKGVKQGCPVGRLLFALYINDLRGGALLPEPGQGDSGGRLGRVWWMRHRVPHSLFAVDLVLLETAGSAAKR